MKLGYKAICLTVDAIVPGNREKDIRAPWVLDGVEKANSVAGTEESDLVRDTGDAEVEKSVNLMGTAGALISNDDRDMAWEKASYVSGDDLRDPEWRAVRLFHG